MMKLKITQCYKLFIIFGVTFLLISCAKAPIRTTPQGISAQKQGTKTPSQIAQQKIKEERIKGANTGELNALKLQQTREELKTLEEFQNQDIHFAFNSYVLSPKAQHILDKKVSWLRKHPSVKIRIEGNCDDRGTEEYNLALGERRANSAKQYLINSGINADRLYTISYGEERPLALGDNETAWAINRRDHFVVLHR